MAGAEGFLIMRCVTALDVVGESCSHYVLMGKSAGCVDLHAVASWWLDGSRTRSWGYPGLV